ncbi:DUF5677 domain-containing protein [Streptomyces sp. NPDC001941]|uniref:DUF5677 domain-containing protein n=1 Tax=Streptomyces sp. NPDC001941 TaxID=3154659 RepID=UPI00332877DF
MTYAFGDNPLCLKRARKITPILLQRAEEVYSSSPQVLLEDQDVAHQLLGWWRFANRTADLLTQAYDAGFNVEAAGLMRNLIEHAHFMDWLAEHQTAGLRAMEEAEWTRRKKMINNFKEIDWPIPAGIEVGEKPTFDFADEAEQAAHSTLVGQASTVANLVAARGIRNLYPVYRYLSSYAHASTQSAEPFVERGPGKAPALHLAGTVAVTESRVWIPVCLYLAGSTVSQFLQGNPMRATLEKAAWDLGFGEIVAERIRLESGNRQPGSSS